MIDAPKILLLSPYDALSHQYWRDGLARYLQASAGLTLVQSVLPPRYFSWRFRGNALTYALQPALQTPFDLIIASSMTDLSALRGMNRHLASTPAILYFHENQFDYPDQHERGLLERQLTSIYSAVSADQLFFNSNYNLTTFLRGAAQLLAKMPDFVPPGIIDSLRAKASVNPIAIEPVSTSAQRKQPADTLNVVWNHRWEYDKAPEVLLEIVQGLNLRSIDYRLSLLGQRFKQQPDSFVDIVEELTRTNCVGTVEFIEDRQDYSTLLASQHVVLSTARHEFQGLAMLEAIQLGCIPVAPDDLCYPEYVPEALRFDGPERAIEILASLAGAVATDSADLAQMQQLNLLAYTWDRVGPKWLKAIEALLDA